MPVTEATRPENRYVKNWDPTQYYKRPAVAESYDARRFSSFSGRLFNWLEKRAIRRAFAGLPATASVADVPCGTGRLAEIPLALGHDVVGFDISPAMLAVASRRLNHFGSKFSTEVMDARDLATAGRRFDAVLCARFLMHFPIDEQGQFIACLAQAARQRVVITQGLNTPFQRARRAVKRMFGRFQAPSAFPIKDLELRTLLAAAGLKEVRRYWVLPLLSESIVIVAEPIRSKD